MRQPNEATAPGAGRDADDLVDAAAAPAPARASGASLRELYEEHGSVLLTYLISMTRGDRHRAEDILQETLMRAWRHPEARSPSGEWSRSWLYTVAKRIAIDHMRASMTRPTELGDERLEERPQTEDPFDQLVDQDAVRAAIAALPERFRDVLVEVYFRDRSVAEAAHLLGIPPGTVKSRTFYALRALQEELVQRGFVDPPSSS